VRYRLTCYPCEDKYAAEGDEGIWHYSDSEPAPTLHDVLRVMKPVALGGVGADEASLESIEEDGTETMLATARRQGSRIDIWTP
jgi:hypothetical protein